MQADCQSLPPFGGDCYYLRLIVKLGVIGLGRRLTQFYQELRKIEPACQIVGLVDSDPVAAVARLGVDEASAISVYDDLSEMVRETKPDALAIGTRCDSHADYAEIAAKFGLPLFLEKPVATTIEQLKKLEGAFADNPCPVLVSFPLRTSPLCRKAKEELLSSKVGRPEHVLAVNYVHYGDIYFTGWFRDYQVTQGLLIQKATHDFDYLSYLIGSPIKRVAAFASYGRVYRDKRLGERESPGPLLEEIGTPEEGMNEDSASVLVEFENGVQGVYVQVFFAKRKAARRGARISGWNGTLDFDWYAGRIETVHHHTPLIETLQFETEEHHFGGDRGLAENFVKMVKAGEPPLATLQDGMSSIRACLAAKKSIVEGRAFDVDEIS